MEPTITYHYLSLSGWWYTYCTLLKNMKVSSSDWIIIPTFSTSKSDYHHVPAVPAAAGRSGVSWKSSAVARCRSQRSQRSQRTSFSPPKGQPGQTWRLEDLRSFCIFLWNQWIGLREILQERPIFHGKNWDNLWFPDVSG